MTQQPNIVFILVDDLGWRDLACYGSTFYETPNLDRLFQQGMHFTDAYAACPVCSPTRASIMSGKYPAAIGLTNYIEPLREDGQRDADDFRSGNARGKLLEAFYIDRLPHTETSLAAALRDGGYKTWHVGKWHLGPREYFPEQHGFDINVGGCQRGHPHKGYFSPWFIETLPDGPEGEYLTDRLTDEAIALIRQNQHKPFFLNYWPYAVHTPLQAPAELIAKYEEKAKELGLDQIQTHEEGDYFPTERKKDHRILRRLVQSHPVYAAMIENLDTNIGRLLRVLKETGQAENTLIIFTSDNGGLATSEGSPTCNAPLSEGKGWMYEGGTREPLIACWPGHIEAGSRCEAPVTSPDFYPTLLELAGLELRPEQHTDGVSFAPLLRGEQTTLERGDALYWHFPHYGNQGGTPGSSIREGDWKLIEFFEDGGLELYNLREDLGETKNLAAEQPELAQRLQQKLAAWREKIEARMPAPNPDFRPWREGHPELE